MLKFQMWYYLVSLSIRERQGPSAETVFSFPCSFSPYQVFSSQSLFCTSSCIGGAESVDLGLGRVETSWICMPPN